MQVRRDKGACLFLLYLRHEIHKILHGWHCVEKPSHDPRGSWSVRQDRWGSRATAAAALCLFHGVSSGITGPTHRVDVVAESGLWMDRAEIHSGQLNRKEFIGRIMKYSQNQEEWWLIELRKSVLNKGNQKAGNSGKINPWDSFVKTVPLTHPSLLP